MKGMVKVDRDAINDALEEFRKKSAVLISEINRCKNELEQSYCELNWWQRLWNEDEYTPKFKVVAKARNMKGVCSILSTNWFIVFCNEKMIDDFTFKELRVTNYWFNYESKTITEIEEMSKAGSDIYLTPLQAEFVNDFKPA